MGNVAVRRKISPSEYAYTRLVSHVASVAVGFEGDVIERTDKPNHPVYDILRRTKLLLHTFTQHSTAKYLHVHCLFGWLVGKKAASKVEKDRDGGGTRTRGERRGWLSLSTDVRQTKPVLHDIVMETDSHRLQVSANKTWNGHLFYTV